mgnify:CR=1 FL=1
MIGLVVRLVILFGVVAGVAYAATKKIRGKKEQERLDSIESDIRALKADQNVGILSAEERAEVLAKAESQARELGGKSS